MSKVFVIDSEGIPLLPTHPARSRKLLRTGKAKVKQVVPFTIQLNRKVENPVGSFEMGIDDGSKYVGIAIKNTKTNEIVFHAELNHRQDVSRLMEQRRNYRKSRRFRLRNRPPRFSNRISFKIAPSIRQRKEAIVRVIKDLSKRLNIIKVIVEEVKFNHSKYHYGKFFSLTEIGKKYLKQQIQKLGLVYETTFGYNTKENRINLNLSKKHSYDACVIVGSNKIIGHGYSIKPKRTKVWKNNPTKTCNEKNGFRHYDIIKATHNTRGTVIGSIRSLKEKVITLRTSFDNNFPVSYKKSKLLWRPNGLIYCRI